jgi:hypothetical protein
MSLIVMTKEIKKKESGNIPKGKRKQDPLFNIYS